MPRCFLPLFLCPCLSPSLFLSGSLVADNSSSAAQQAFFGLNPGVTVLIEFDHVDKRPTKPATPGDKRASETLPIFEGSEVCFPQHAAAVQDVYHFFQRGSIGLLLCGCCFLFLSWW